MISEKSHWESMGFTLIEVIVTLAIIATISSVSLVNFQKKTATSAYSAGHDILSSDLRLVAVKALNSERFQNQQPTGWGIHFVDNSNSYTLFADLDADREYDTREKIKGVNLDLNVKIQWEGYTTGDLIFNTGDGLTFVNNTRVPVTPTAHLFINIENEDNKVQKSIEINSLGTVSD